MPSSLSFIQSWIPAHGTVLPTCRGRSPFENKSRNSLTDMTRGLSPRCFWVLSSGQAALTIPRPGRWLLPSRPCLFLTHLAKLLRSYSTDTRDPSLFRQTLSDLGAPSFTLKCESRLHLQCGGKS